MLKTILSIAGKPGLYKLISSGKNMLIVETVDAAKKRIPAYGQDKVISLADIAMYTDAEEVPLSEVLESVKNKENGTVASIDYKKASANELHAYFAEILPNYDRDRVHTSDIKKLLSWYNILVNNGITEFVEGNVVPTEEPGSYPVLAMKRIASSVIWRVIPLSASIFLIPPICNMTICSISSLFKGKNMIVSSIRFRNSGRIVFFNIDITSFFVSSTITSRFSSLIFSN